MFLLSNIPILLTSYNIDTAEIKSGATTGTWSKLYTLGESVAIGLFTILQKVAIFGLVLSIVMLGVTLFTMDSGSGREKVKANLIKLLLISIGLSAVTTLVTAAVQIGASL